MLARSLSNNNYTVQHARHWKVSRHCFFYTFCPLGQRPSALEVERSAKGGNTRRELNTANCPATKPIRAGIPKASSINSNHKLAS